MLPVGVVYSRVAVVYSREAVVYSREAVDNTGIAQTAGCLTDTSLVLGSIQFRLSGISCFRIGLFILLTQPGVCYLLGTIAL